MNPHLFCRERTFHKALLLTYSFDPIFFEQVVLPDLWSGRTGDILAMGDRQQIIEATTACAGQLWHLGRHYLLAPANHEGAFHPKLILRLGAKDGAVLIGSGNLTSSGWGGNQELGVGWLLGPGHADDGAWLHQFLADVMSWCSSDLERDAVARMTDVPWLALTSASITTSGVLYSRRDTALASSLAQRWAGRQFDSVRILTGSTDKSGAFLRWAHRTFGIKRAMVALTPAMASFDPAQLADLPIELTLITAPRHRPMHAKFYWFDGDDGAAAVMGSANCSASAWLLPPKQGGNIETVVVYDAASAGDFLDVLRIFDGPAMTAQDLLASNAARPIDPVPAAPAFRLLGLRWDRDAALLSAVVDPCPALDDVVDLLWGKQTLPMTPPADPGGQWTARLREDFDKGTEFGRVRITRGGASWMTAPRWIDDLALLQQASQTARLLAPFNGFEGTKTQNEQRQMLEDLQNVAHALFNDASALRDPSTGATRSTKAENELAAVPVDPRDLVCHLEESSLEVPSLADDRPSMPSITGILRLLFDAEGDGSATVLAKDGDDPDDGNDEAGDNKKSGHSKPEPGRRDDESRPIEPRFRERLALQIATFLEELRTDEFAARCSATQMVQAVAYPLAVALLGTKHGWVNMELAEAWRLDVISILFGSTDVGGLLQAVEQRYVENGQGEIFGDVVGDGTLWMVLIATIGGSRWYGPGTYLDKAIAMREVFMAPQLRSSARRERIDWLRNKVRIDGAQKYLGEVAPAVTKLLEEIEARLHPVWVDEAKAQAQRQITHRAGDLLWRENVGWAACLEDNALEFKKPTRVRLKGREKNIVAGFYVNVSELARRDGELHQYLVELFSRVDGAVDDA